MVLVLVIVLIFFVVVLSFWFPLGLSGSRQFRLVRFAFQGRFWFLVSGVEFLSGSLWFPLVPFGSFWSPLGLFCFLWLTLVPSGCRFLSGVWFLVSGFCVLASCFGTWCLVLVLVMVLQVIFSVSGVGSGSVHVMLCFWYGAHLVLFWFWFCFCF